MSNESIALRDTKAILAAFSNAFNKHMLACEFHCGSLSFVSTLCISYTLLFILCQHFYLSFLKKVLLFCDFFNRLTVVFEFAAAMNFIGATVQARIPKADCSHVN